LNRTRNCRESRKKPFRRLPSLHFRFLHPWSRSGFFDRKSLESIPFEPNSKLLKIEKQALNWRWTPPDRRSRTRDRSIGEALNSTTASRGRGTSFGAVRKENTRGSPGQVLIKKWNCTRQDQARAIFSSNDCAGAAFVSFGSHGDRFE
jgi:hypothetical protein